MFGHAQVINKYRASTETVQEDFQNDEFQTYIKEEKIVSINKYIVLFNISVYVYFKHNSRKRLPQICPQTGTHLV